MGDAVLWLVLWVLFLGIGEVVAYLLTFGLFALVAVAIDQEWLAVVGVVLGWIAALGWFAFAAYHVIMQVISIVQLL